MGEIQALGKSISVKMLNLLLVPMFPIVDTLHYKYRIYEVLLFYQVAKSGAVAVQVTRHN